MRCCLCANPIHLTSSLLHSPAKEQQPAPGGSAVSPMLWQTWLRLPSAGRVQIDGPIRHPQCAALLLSLLLPLAQCAAPRFSPRCSACHRAPRLVPRIPQMPERHHLHCNRAECTPACSRVSVLLPAEPAPPPARVSVVGGCGMIVPKLAPAPWRPRRRAFFLDLHSLRLADVFTQHAHRVSEILLRTSPRPAPTASTLSEETARVSHGQKVSQGKCAGHTVEACFQNNKTSSSPQCQ